MAKIIDLKISSLYFDDVQCGKKTFELRFNDRQYDVGDILILREFDGVDFTGRIVSVVITYILQDCGFGLVDNYVILGIALHE